MSDAELTIGTRLSERYEVREVLGQGTLGPAYKVYDHARGRTALLKLLPERFRKKNVLAKRFIKHFRTLQGRDHPGLMKTLEVAVHEGAPFVVNEFLEGLSLRQLIEARRAEGGPFSFAEVESILEEVGQILSFLHQSGFHGGVRPENVFLLPDRVKLSDDGMMEILPPEVYARIHVRNPHAAPYLAPEILSDPEHVTKEVDVYGAAAVVYTLLSGRAPQVPLAKLKTIDPNLPNGIDEVVGKALSDQPGYRFPSINTFLLEFARLGGDKQKVKVLEAVVDAEAQEEAKRAAKAAIAQVQAREAEVKAQEPVELKPVTPAAPPPASDHDVKQLFEDDTDAPKPAAGAAVAPGEATDLLGPTPTIATTATKKRTPLIAAGAAVAVAAIAAVAMVVLRSGSGTAPAPAVAVAPPAAAPVAPPAMDPRLKSSVDKVIQTTEAVERELLGYGEAVSTNPAFQRAAATLAEARTALHGGDATTALEKAQSAQEQYAALLDLLNVNAEQIAAASQAAALAAAEAEKAKAAAPAKPAPEVAKASSPAEAKASSESGKSEPAKSAAAAKGSGCPSGMIEVPAGPFQMGSPADDFLRDATERPVEKVSVGAFCIDKFEAPNKAGSRPKTSLTQAEAAAECAANGRRLCSEAEWEKACKGPRSNDYPYGKTWDPNVCNTETATGEDRSLKPVGGHDGCVSDYGVFDLSGNVLEWTATVFEANGKLVIAKGGSYMRPDYAARCAYRYTTPGATKDAEIGYRCCADR